MASGIGNQRQLPPPRDAGRSASDVETFQHLTGYTRPTNYTKPLSHKRPETESPKDTRILQLLWATFLFATIGVPATIHGGVSIAAGLLLFINVAACVACFRDYRVGWGLAMLFVGVVLLQQTYANVTLVWSVASGSESNVVGTVMLVVVNTTLLVVPALLICIGYYINRKRLCAILFPLRSSCDGAGVAKTHSDPTRCDNPYTPPESQ